MIRYRAITLGILSILASVAWGQEAKIKGLIIGRSGSTMIIRAQDAGTLTVMLTDSTQVGQKAGVFRRKEMSMASLIPGLAVEIEATHADNNQLVAKSVKFSGDDMKRAQSVQAGLHETRMQTHQNQQEIEKNKAEIEKSKAEIARSQAELEQQRAALQAQNEALQRQQAQSAEHQKKIAENKTAIAAAMARFGQLDDYYILDEVTVYFGNGKVNLDAKYEPDLRKLADKAKKFDGYMIEVKGYASSAGSTELNQKLSDDRGDNVANFLIQQCHIPQTNMLAPTAMGESQQVGDEKSAEGQAKNRRVVVRILQNKGIVGAGVTGGE